MVRLTLEGELGTDIDIRPDDLADVRQHMEAVLVRVGAIGVAYDFETITKEPTVRGQFVRDVLAADLPEKTNAEGCWSLGCERSTAATTWK